MIIGDGWAQIITPPVEPEQKVLIQRDFIGWNTYPEKWVHPQDLTWNGPDHISQREIATNFSDVDLGYSITSGTSYLTQPVGHELISNDLEDERFAIGVQYDAADLLALPSEASAKIVNIFYLIAPEGEYVRGDFVKDGASVYAEIAHGTFGGTKHTYRHTTALSSGWDWMFFEFHRTTGLDSLYLIVEGSAESSAVGGLVNDAVYTEFRVAYDTAYPDDTKALKLGNMFFQRDSLTGPEVSDIRGFLNQNQMDGWVDTNSVSNHIAHYWRGHLRGSEVYGDGYIHNISGKRAEGLVTGGSLKRSTSGGPINYSGYHEFTNGAFSAAESVGPQTQWGHTMGFYFKKVGDLSQDGWFIRLEASSGGTLTLESVGNGTAIAVVHSVDGQVSRSMITDLFDGEWHKLAFSTHDSASTSWRMYIDNHYVMQDTLDSTVPSWMGFIDSVEIGNIDCQMAYFMLRYTYDTNVFDGWFSARTEGALLAYGQANAYEYYYPMQSPNTGL